MGIRLVIPSTIPNPALRTLLAHDNLFQQLVASQCRVTFANAYPPFFFQRLARNSARRSATSYAVHAAGVRYRDIDDLREGNAVSAFVTTGFEILSNIRHPWDEIAYMTKCHHEKVDGTGYPQGLRGDEIPLGSRIVTLADSFDAMMTDRPYRKALSLQPGLAEAGHRVAQPVAQRFEIVQGGAHGASGARRSRAGSAPRCASPAGWSCPRTPPRRPA